MCLTDSREVGWNATELGKCPPLPPYKVHLIVCEQHVLHDVPDFDERWRFLETLKNRLEALVSPLLISAINTHATGMCLLPW